MLEPAQGRNSMPDPVACIQRFNGEAVRLAAFLLSKCPPGTARGEARRWYNQLLLGVQQVPNAVFEEAGDYVFRLHDVIANKDLAALKGTDVEGIMARQGVAGETAVRVREFSGLILGVVDRLSAEELEEVWGSLDAMLGAFLDAHPDDDD